VAVHVGLTGADRALRRDHAIEGRVEDADTAAQGLAAFDRTTELDLAFSILDHQLALAQSCQSTEQLGAQAPVQTLQCRHGQGFELTAQGFA